MSKFIRLGLALLLLQVLGSSLKAQQSDIKFEHISIELGLSQSGVNCILQDRYGFLWIGTQDGLNRYDGYSFKIYRHNSQDASSLSANYILTIYEDKSGALWIGTFEGGLNKFDPRTQKFTVYRNDPNSPGSIAGNTVRSIYEDGSGTLWVGADGGGLNKFDPKSEKFTVYRNDPKNPNSLSHNSIHSICEDRSGMLWIGTLGGGLNKFDPKSEKFTVYLNDPKNPASLSSNNIDTVYIDGSGTLWIGTLGGGLNKLDPKSEKFTVYRNDLKNPTSLSHNSVHSICEDESGTLWIGTEDGGLNRFDRKSEKFAAYRNDPKNPNSVGNNSVYSVYRDRSGILWIGSLGGGLNKFDPRTNKFAAYQSDPDKLAVISYESVRSIYEDRSGALWIGTHGSGLNRIDPKTKKVTIYKNDPNNPKSIGGNIIYSIYEDGSGTLWIGTDGGGLNKFDSKTESFTAYKNDPDNPKSISSNVVYPIYEDGKGRLWIGTYGGGLNRFDPKTQGFAAYKNDPENPAGIIGNNFRSICEDRKGRLWLAIEGGLNMFDPETEKFIAYRNDPNNPNSISSNVVTSVLEDDKGIIWISTYGGGLNRFDPENKTFTAFTEKDGLANDAVYGALEDKEGNLWLSTNKGISKFNPQTKKFRNYDVNDGLQSNEFNSGAYFKSRNGELFFGGPNGFNRFYPEQIKDNPFIPPVFVTAFKISDKPTPKESLALARSLGLVENSPLELSYEENEFTFEFAALNYTHSEKNQYAYKLEGYNKDWIECGARRFAIFTNLNPGEYVFRVKGSNNDGIWNEQGTFVKIRIAPPPWRAWWAYLLYLSGLVSAGYGVYRYRLNAIEKRYRIERAVEIDKKNRELESKNEELADKNNELARQKEALSRKNEELASKNDELLESNRRADRIFSALAEALPGTVLDGKYRLDEKIGSGGFGAVYRAAHLALKRSIAVKIFKPSPGNDSAEALERFRLEAVSACRINHPNAVAVLDSGISSDGIAYLVMELLEGHTLTAELQRKKILSIERAAQILPPVCEALAKAHSIGIVHRDIKPDNIFLHRGDRGEIVKVVDFGIAKLMEAGESVDVKSLTGTGGIIGTPTYMSPERLEGKPYDGRSDVYSLGVTLYEMLAGRAPFQSDSRGVFGLVQMHLARDPKPLREFNPNIPEAVEAVVMRALEKAPEKRPSAKELAEQFLEAAGIDPAEIEKIREYESEFEDAESAERWPTLEHEKMPGLTDRVYKRVGNLAQSVLKRDPDKKDDGADKRGWDLQKEMEAMKAAEAEAKRENLIEPERWRKIKDLFFSAMDCESERRAAFLDEACGGDDDLRSRVEELIAADEK